MKGAAQVSPRRQVLRMRAPGDLELLLHRPLQLCSLELPFCFLPSRVIGEAPEFFEEASLGPVLEWQVLSKVFMDMVDEFDFLLSL